MSLEIKVPVLPESVSDATIATWHKKPGDAVKRDENLVDLETDKVVLEVPAPADDPRRDRGRCSSKYVERSETRSACGQREACGQVRRSIRGSFRE